MSPVHESRRKFLLDSATAASGLFLGGIYSIGNAGSATQLGKVIGPGKGKNSSTGDDLYFIGIYDLDGADGKVRTIRNIDFFGHGITPHPIDTKRAVVFEKHGKGCCEIDLSKAQVLRKIETIADRQFYGHGAFSPDGRFLYAAETVVSDGSMRGVVAVRDGQSFGLLGDFPSYGLAPHDCHLIDDGETLVFSNGGGLIGSDDYASVTYVGAKDRALKRRVTISDPGLNAGHIAISSSGQLAIVSAPRDGIEKKSRDWRGNISFYDPQKDQLRLADDPIRSKMVGETLSVAIHEPSMIVGATNPTGNLVTFWDFASGKLVKAIEGQYRSPRGISLTLDQRYFVLTYDKSTHLILLDAETFEPVESSYLPVSYMAGSHNLVYGSA
ncbi:MAG: DUF1513 domain-containing protein [Candidatus Thiodiazotropha sp. LLP2]